MALAIKFEQLLKDGSVRDYADLARLGSVSRARITQIMNLRLLAPRIHEQLIFHERVQSSEDDTQLRDLQSVALEADWGRQGDLWHPQKQIKHYSSCEMANNLPA